MMGRMMNLRGIGLVALLALGSAMPPGRAEGGFLIEVDTDGANNAAVTYSSHFAFGGDTASASASVPSTAVGMTGGNSIFGGDGVSQPDTYLYTYTPGTDADNLNLIAGTDLGDGNLATGLAGGPSGRYNVYATWPFTTNVSGGLTTYTLTGGGQTVLNTQVDQNNKGHDWILLGSASLDSGTTYTLAQLAGSNTFVSMRAAGVLFELVQPVPEPASAALLALGAAGLLVWSRRGGRDHARAA
jgi:hypothetical protein